jgi:hypothetical protein
MTSVLGLAQSMSVAYAQRAKIPGPDDLQRTLANPGRRERLIMSVTNLRLSVFLILGQDAVDKYLQSSKAFSALANELRNQEVSKEVIGVLSGAPGMETAQTVERQLLSVSARIESVLEKGGVIPGGRLASEMIVGFVQMTQFLTIRSAKNSNWYCRIYPLDYFC